MNVVSAIVAYLVIWWLTLFIVLPFGVRSQHDEGESTLGTAESAPVRPMLWRKFFVTTVVAGLLWGGLYWVVDSQLVSYDDILYFDPFERTSPAAGE